MDTTVDTLPPHDLNAERCLVGSLAICGSDAEAFECAAATAPPEAMFSADHAILLRALLDMHHAGKAIDATTLRAELVRRGQFEEVGGLPYLVEILNAVPSWQHWRQYAAIVRDRWQRRRALDLARTITHDAYGAGDDADGIFHRAARRVEECLTDSMPDDVHSLQTLATEVYTAIEREMTPDPRTGELVSAAVPTGFTTIDCETGGIRPGEFVVLGARPSVGKSTLLKQMALNMGRSGVPVAYFSLEESAEKVARNLLSAVSTISNSRIRRRELDARAWQSLADGVGHLSGLPIWIIDRTTFRARDIRSRATMLRSRHGIRAIFLDYLQLVDVGSHRDEFARATAQSREVCDIGKRLELPLIAAAQLNRACETRENHEPKMSDLRATGQIEQDADAILFLHRDDAFHIGDAGYQPTHRARLIVAKWRDAQRDYAVDLREELAFQRFVEDLAPEVP